MSSFAATLVVITFFVTSSDSGSLVIDIITAGGDPEPPVPQRIFWAVTEGVVAAILLFAGGLYYGVKARSFRHATFAFPKMTFKENDRDVHHRAMVYTREGSQDYGIMGYEKEQVIANFMHEYDRQLRWQKPTKRGS